MQHSAKRCTCGGSKPSGRGRHLCDACQSTANARKQARYKNAHPERKLVIYARSTAHRKGLPCNLKFGDVSIPKRCPVLGIPLFFTPGRRTHNTPTIDRINNSRGYVRGNVHVVSWRLNDLKKDASLEELCKVASFFVKRRAG